MWQGTMAYHYIYLYRENPTGSKITVSVPLSPVPLAILFYNLYVR